MKEVSTKIAYRIHVTPQGWEIEADGERLGVYYPTWSEAYEALCILKSAEETEASNLRI